MYITACLDCSSVLGLELKVAQRYELLDSLVRELFSVNEICACDICTKSREFILSVIIKSCFTNGKLRIMGNSICEFAATLLSVTASTGKVISCPAVGACLQTCVVEPHPVPF